MAVVVLCGCLVFRFYRKYLVEFLRGFVVVAFVEITVTGFEIIFGYFISAEIVDVCFFKCR
jgi:hypothetical protein